MTTSAAVVTGLAVVAPNGYTTEEFWAATLAGTNGIARITAFDPGKYPATLAGEVCGFDAASHVPARLMAQTDQMTHLALVCAARALADSAANPADFDEYAMAVITSCSSGGAVFGQRELQKLWSTGPIAVGPFIAVSWFYAANTGQISIRHGMRGPCGAVAAEQAGGLDVLGQARRELRRGTQLALVGGTDASLSPGGLMAQIVTGMLATGTDPATTYTPFDRKASGYVPGEGGALFTMENEEAARRRGAPRYGTIAGYAATFDPPPGSDRPPTLLRAAELALAEARIGAADVDVVFADASGVPDLDRQEAAVLIRLFGPSGVPVTAPKTMTGRLLAGGAAVDVAAALLAIRDQVIPPSVHIREPADYAQHLDLVLDQPRPARIHTILVLARGYGGFNAAVVVRR